MRPKATRTINALSFAVLFCFLFSVILIAQDFQIRTRVDLVVVPVSVKNHDSDLVSGLTKNDFRIYEDGIQQDIASFSIDPVPISAAVLVDTGVSQPAFDKIRASFPALAGAFSDFDEYTLYRFDKFVTKLLDFTDKTALLETALQQIREPATVQSAGIVSGPFSTVGPVIDGVPIIPGGPQPGPRPYPQGAKLLNDAVFTAADDLATRKPDRRRMILIISDGQTKGDEHSFSETVDRLLDNGIEVYAVGLEDAYVYKRLNILREYAEKTGGDACFLNGVHKMETCYARSAEEARNQYILGYVSNNKPIGPLRIFREIRVELDRPNLEARYRRGYFQYP